MPVLRGMKAKILRIGIIALLVAGVSVLIIFITRPAGAVMMKIEVSKVTIGNISTTVTATGTLEPVKTVSVGTQVSGVVKKIYVDYNTAVTEGQLIAELDKTNMIAAVNESKISLKAAEDDRDYLRSVLERQNTLFKNSSISKSELDEAQYKYTSALNIVEQRKGELARAQTNLGYADIYSPIDGIVLSKAVDVGQTVAASFNTPTLFTIAQDLSKMQVAANVDEADIGNVEVGQKVSFTVDAWPAEEFVGIVRQVRLNASVSSGVVTYTVIVDVDNTSLKLLPGLTATISIETREAKDVMLIETKGLSFKNENQTIEAYNASLPAAYNPDPKAASNKSSEKALSGFVKVFVKQKDGYVTEKYIKTGINDGVHVEVKEGLTLGDEVVYECSQTTEDIKKSSGTNKSPFMPTPPGQKK
jgi:HlyD family secretion protein